MKWEQTFCMLVLSLWYRSGENVLFGGKLTFWQYLGHGIGFNLGMFKPGYPRPWLKSSQQIYLWPSHPVVLCHGPRLNSAASSPGLSEVRSKDPHPQCSCSLPLVKELELTQRTVRRELLCLPCPSCGGQLAFWFWRILLYDKAPSHFPPFPWEVGTVLYMSYRACCTHTCPVWVCCSSCCCFKFNFYQ